MPTRVLAVDCGATSVRVCSVDLDSRREPEVLHRWPHAPVQLADGSPRWDWPGLLAAVEHGLALGLAAGPVASIGIDTWGVDYGLLDDTGALLSWPHCYRSERTSGWRSVVDRIGAEHLYRTTGIQLQPFNTLFQLAAHDRSELQRASRLLMLPELIAHHLTGAVTGEVTSAGTTGLVDIADGTWSAELLDAIDVDSTLLPPIEAPGRQLGQWHGIPVTLVGGHDTASAVAAVPVRPGDGTAYVATGSWFLVGVLSAQPVLSTAAAEANFTNEPAVGGPVVSGGVRLLKNVTGLHLLERLRSEWGDPPLDRLLADAAASSGDVPLVDPDDQLFASPGLDATLRDITRLGSAASRGLIVRCVLASLAAATARVLDEVADVTGVRPRRLVALGGGVRNQLLLDLLEAHCRIPVVRGPAEATALGNALVQGIGIGHFADLAEAHDQLIFAPATSFRPDAP